MLPLTPIVDVQVNISDTPGAATGFDAGLIIGPSSKITTTERIKEYASLDDITEDGFAASSPEYQAALLYFSAFPKPRRVLIGVKGTEETDLEALQACFATRSDFYTAMVCDAMEADILEAAAHVQAITSRKTYCYTTADENVLDSASTTDVMAKLASAKYSRTFGMYSTDNPYAIAAVMGYIAGANASSFINAYTLMFKKLPGLNVEPLSSTQVKAVQSKNGNVYVERGETYPMFEKGRMANGNPIDEVMGLDMVALDIQFEVMNLFTSSPKVGQTTSGVQKVVTATGAALARHTGGDDSFISPGIWTGEPLLTLNTGDALEKGYIVLSGSLADQSQADREKRAAPPIYACCKLAGAIENAIIAVNVNR